MPDEMQSRYPEALRDLVDKIVEHLRHRRGFAHGDARTLAFEVVGIMAEEYAGQQIYFSRGHIVTERDRRIYREFNGSNHALLAHKYGVTERHIYRLVERVRAEEIAARQVPLPFNSI